MFQCKAFRHVAQVKFLDHKYSFQLTTMGCVCADPRAKCPPRKFIHLGLKRTRQQLVCEYTEETKKPLKDHIIENIDA